MKKNIIYISTFVVIIALFVAAIFLGKKNTREKEEATKLSTVASGDNISEDVYSINKGFSYKEYIELGDYKNIIVEKPVVKVSDGEVQDTIDEELSEQIDITNRECKNDDDVSVDFTGTIDGKEFEGGTETDYVFTLGSNTLLPELEKGIKGMKIGQEKNITATFPNNYSEVKLQNKKAVFKVKLNSITEYKVKKLNDENAKAAGYKSADDMKIEIRKGLEQTNNEDSRQQLVANILEAIRKISKLKSCPDELYKRMDEQTKLIASNEVEAIEGITLEDYIKETIGDEKKYKKYIEEQVFDEFILQALASLEQIHLTQGEYEDSVKEFFDEDNTTIEDVEDLYGKDALMENIFKNKIIDDIITKITVKEVEQNDEIS